MKLNVKKLDRSGKLVDKQPEKKAKKAKEKEVAPVNTINKFTCKAILGLGITSVTDFVALCNKYKALREAGISYYTPSSVKFNKKDHIQVFDSVKELFRFVGALNSSHVVVISEVPAILKEIRGMIPLDYDQQRSFEFNFKQIDVNVISKVLKSKTQTVESALVSNDNLGYHIDRIKNTSDMTAAFISLTSNLPFDQRTVLRKSMAKFFSAKKPDVKVVTDTIAEIAKTFKVKDEAKKLIEVFTNEGSKYFTAVNAEGTSITTIANQHGVDAYTLSYMKKLMRNTTIVNARNAKSNVSVLG